MTVKVYGAKEIVQALEEVAALIDDDALVLDSLSSLLNDYVPVRTGYLRDHVERSDWELNYVAPYAGFVEERQEFAQRAIDDFNFEQYADKVVEPY